MCVMCIYKTSSPQKSCVTFATDWMTTKRIRIKTGKARSESGTQSSMTISQSVYAHTHTESKESSSMIKCSLSKGQFEK